MRRALAYELVYKFTSTDSPATIAEWRDDARTASPASHAAHLAALAPADDPAWILRLTPEQIAAQLTRIAARPDAATLPLYGVPFAIKDNIDVASLPTTAGCPSFAYTATATAPAVQRLLDAGAILVGKTNLDQFATGLVGTRSPYGAVPNAFNPRYIAGGSSSGSAVAVARGQVAFALGTDTAGSGRVPAGFNNLVGLKPTRGWLSTRGVVPACRTLDCVSVFALTVADAAQVAALAAGPDDDAYSRPAPAGALGIRLPARPRFGVPASSEFFGDTEAAARFSAACERIRTLGAELVPLDFAPLHETAALLYQGPWVAERFAAVGEFLAKAPADADPTVSRIVAGAAGFDAVSVFKAQYRLAELRVVCDHLLGSVDALLVPTAPTIYTLEEIARDPLGPNARLGTYTNFVNLLDCCALALPAGFRGDGLPVGITLIAPAWRDAALAEFGQRWQQAAPWTLGALGRAPAAAEPADLPFPARKTVRLAVVGAHLAGLPLNSQLTERAAVFVEKTTTSADYRLFALPGTTPPKPGLLRTGGGAPIEVELWDVPEEHFGSFVALIPAPLGIGTLALADGRSVKGFICEPYATDGARDITAFGGWRAYLRSLASN